MCILIVVYHLDVTAANSSCLMHNLLLTFSSLLMCSDCDSVCGQWYLVSKSFYFALFCAHVLVKTEDCVCLQAINCTRATCLSGSYLTGSC
jgi:hypothetical protein